MTTTPVALPPRSPFGRFGFAALAVSVAVLFAGTRAAASPTPLTALAGGLAVGYLPGLGLALWMENRRGFWASWILPLILSPTVATFVGFLLTGSGFSLEQAVAGIVFLSVIAVLFAPPPAREIEEWAVSLDRPGTSYHPDRQQVLMLSLVVMLAVGLPLLARPGLVRTSAPMVHAAVVGEIERHGLPPTDPFFAGAPLTTAWAFESYMALLRAGTGLGVEAILAGGSLIAALGLVFTAYRLLALLGLSHLRAMWGVIFLFLAQNGGSWIWSREPESFLERLLPAGPAVLGLVSLFLFLGAAIASQGEGRRRAGLAVAGAVGGLLFHPELAVAGFAVSLCAVPLTFIAGRQPIRGAVWDLLTGVCVPVALALLFTGPYLATLRGAGGWRFGPFVDNPGSTLVPLLGALLPAMLLAGYVLVRLFRAAEARRVAWGIWTLLALGAALFLRFPGPRGSGVALLLAFPPLALCAGVAVPGMWRAAGPRRKALCAAGLVLMLLPTTVLGLAGAFRAGAGPDGDRGLRDAAEWVRDIAPADAVIADTTPDLVLGAGRTLLFTQGTPPPTWSPAALALRRRCHEALLDGRPLDAEERAHLLGLGAPVLVIRRDAPAAPTAATVAAGDYHEVFRGDGVVILGLSASFPEPGSP